MKKYLYPLLVIAMAILLAPAVAAFAQVQINPNLPGTNPITTGTGGPGGFVANFYQFALMIGGVLAFGAVVYGGVKYITAAGNPSGQSEAKEWITSALLGLLLLGGAYFILNVINPDLLNLNLPTLEGLSIAPPAGIGPTGGGPTGAGCSGTACTPLRDNGFTCKPASQQPNGIDSCSAAQGMINTLNCIKSQPGVSGFTVTEAMPPTVSHISRCHNNGCCVDVVVSNQNCQQVQALVQAAVACGGSAANEYPSCGGTTYETTVGGGNIHINSAPGNGC